MVQVLSGRSGKAGYRTAETQALSLTHTHLYELMFIRNDSFIACKEVIMFGRTSATTRASQPLERSLENVSLTGVTATGGSVSATGA